MMTKACVNSHRTPVEAHHGFLCDDCLGNLRWALQKAPGALQHLREVYVLRRTGDLEDETRPLKKDPPAPFNLDAFQLAEDMWIAITGHYIPTHWNHAVMYSQAYNACQDIHQDLRAVVNKKEVIYLLPLINLTRLALYRYPLEEKPRATLLPCPECDQKTIYTPPQAFEDDLEVKCHACGFTIPPEKMEFYASLAEQERR